MIREPDLDKHPKHRIYRYSPKDIFVYQPKVNNYPTSISYDTRDSLTVLSKKFQFAICVRSGPKINVLRSVDPRLFVQLRTKNSKLKIFYSRKFQVQRRRILTYAHMTFIALIFSAQKSEEKIVNLIFRKSQVQHRLLGHPMHVHLIQKKILSHYISWNM